MTFHDDPGKFNGENALVTLLEKHGHNEAWQELVGEFLEVVEHWETTDLDYREALSFDAPSEPTSGHEVYFFG